MRTLITSIIPQYEGVDNTVEYNLPDNIDWQLRFYCNQCGEEVSESDTDKHTCTGVMNNG